MTEYSALDGMGKISELLERAKELGQTALALTEHGSTSGLWELQEKAKEYGIKPILGTEFYCNGIEDKNAHLIVLAMNDVGLSNMFKLQEFAYVDNFYRKPRINEEKLFELNEGLIVLSACLAGNVSQYILKDDMASAVGCAKRYKEVFGDRYYLELQPNSLVEQVTVNKGLVYIANMLGIELVATNDVHYVLEEDWYAHEVMLALQSKKKWDDPKRFKFTTQDFWLKSEEEMRDGLEYLGSDIVNRAINNTVIISELCTSTIQSGRYIPHYHECEEHEERELLVKKTKQGIINKDYKEHTADIQHEINVIDEEGYSGYFLIVQDYINTAREKDILVGDGRGSGCGSKVGYALDIHRVDPSKYNLLFERFMAHGREPDIDVDFSDQEAVIQDLCDKYGEENVARIISLGTMTPKSMSRKVFNCFGVSQIDIKKINSFISITDSTIEEALAREPELRKIASKYGNEFDLISKLQNRISHESQHAGGVVIWKGLSSVLPIKTLGENRNRRIVAFDKYMLEEIGK